MAAHRRLGQMGGIRPQGHPGHALARFTDGLQTGCPGVGVLRRWPSLALQACSRLAFTSLKRQRTYRAAFGGALTSRELWCASAEPHLAGHVTIVAWPKGGGEAWRNGCATAARSSTGGRFWHAGDQAGFPCGPTASSIGSRHRLSTGGDARFRGATAPGPIPAGARCPGRRGARRRRRRHRGRSCQPALPSGQAGLRSSYPRSSARRLGERRLGMLSLPATVRIWLCAQPTDLRKSFDSLASIVRDALGGDPLSGNIFVFRNNVIRCRFYFLGKNAGLTPDFLWARMIV